jgi:hypothetical protein
LQKNLGVGVVREKLAPARDQFLSQLGVIVNFPIKNKHRSTIWRNHGLSPAGNINNG